MVKPFVAGNTAGGVYSPALLIVPIRELPPGTPFTLQFTGAPGPVAVKACDVPSATFAVLGETAKPGGAGGGVGVGEGDGTGVGVGEAAGVGVGLGPFAATSVLLAPAPLPPHATILSARQQITISPESLLILD
jgi:hypothetical protein